MRPHMDAPVAERVYGCLLRAYPSHFRARFEDGMRATFALDHQAARARGRRALLAFWLHTVIQALYFGLAERRPFGATRGDFDAKPSGATMTARFRYDWRDAVRALRTSPMVTTVAVLSLALGIGANTALFSILNGLTLKSLPVHEPDRLVLLDDGAWTNPIWEAIRARESQVVEGAFAWSAERFDLAARGETEFVDGAYVSGRMFDVLGVPPFIGRTVGAADDIRGSASAVAVISYDFWQRRYGGTTGVLGSTMLVQRVPFTIVGVMRPGFFGPDVGRSADVMLPLASEALIRGGESRLDVRLSWWLDIMARLKPGQTAEAAGLALQGVQPQIREETRPQDWPKTERDNYLTTAFSFSPAATGRSPLRAQYRQPLTAILVVVGLVLLVACANLANLLIARATARRHELSVRMALGASRMRLARQLLLESGLLAAAGSILGLAFAHWGSRLLVAQLSSVSPVVLDLTLDWRVLLFTAGVGLLTALLFGLGPALGVTRISATEAIGDHGRRVIGDRRMGLRNALVVVQVALSLVLVVAAVLFGRTFASLATLDPGFDPHPVLIANVSALKSRVPAADRLGLYERLRDAAASVPGVSHAALSVIAPMSGSAWNTRLDVPGGPELAPRDRAPMLNAITPGWFATYGLRLTAGRDIDDRDRPGTPPVAVVNGVFARRFFPGRSPIGARVGINAGMPDRAEIEIVGQVEDAVYRSLRADVPPTMYFPFAQQRRLGPGVAVSIRSASGSPELLSRSVADALGRVDSDLALTLRPLSRQIGVSLTQERIVAMLSGFFGLLALLLSGLGLYGVTSYAVHRRRAEIGIRLALGANPGRVVRLVLGRVGWMILIGTTLGAALSWWASQFVRTLVYGMEPRDPPAFIVAAATLACVGAAAAWLPARRASRVDPTIVLRMD